MGAFSFFLLIIVFYIVISIIELVNLHHFNLKAFEFGFPVFRHLLSTNINRLKEFDGIIEKKEANYVILSEYKLGFFVTKFDFVRRNSILFKSIGFPLTIYGRFKIEENQLIIKGNISYRLLLILSLPIIYFLLIPFIYMKIKLVIPGLLFIGIELVIVYILYTFQKSKMNIICEEVKEILLK